MTAAKALNASVPAPDFQFEVFHDGDCPLCEREVSMLKRRDRHGRILFTDIARPNFSAQGVGKTQQELMGSIHGRTPDGQWVYGVEVFRRLYSLVGFSPLVKLTRIWPISRALDWGYERFAKKRLALTGRCGSDSACAIGQAQPKLD